MSSRCEGPAQKADDVLKSWTLSAMALLNLE